MKRLLSLLLVLILVLLCDTTLVGSALASGAMFEGKWEDTVSQRAWMRIDQNWDGNYDVRVFWGGGIYEGSEWYMTGVFDPTVDSLAYSNGSHYYCTYDGNGNTTNCQTQYESASGIIWIDSNGYLRFLSNDSDLNSRMFVWSGK